MVSTVSEILSLKQPIQTELLVVVFDLTNFTKFSRLASSSDLFQKMSVFNEITSTFVKKNQGLLVKFIGDAGLCVFPISTASSAIEAMVDLKAEVDVWLNKNIPGSHLAVNCHVGSVTIGPTPGFNGNIQTDVFGDAVNICFTLSNRGFVISPQAFRSLSTDARRQFKKFTPPITYHLATTTGGER